MLEMKASLWTVLKEENSPLNIASVALGKVYPSIVASSSPQWVRPFLPWSPFHPIPPDPVQLLLTDILELETDWPALTWQSHPVAKSKASLPHMKLSPFASPYEILWGEIL